MMAEDRVGVEASQVVKLDEETMANFIYKERRQSYEFFLGMFFSSGSISELEEERVKLIAHDLLCQFQELSREECSLDDFRVNAALTIADKLPQFYETFTAFMENATKLQDTIKFWYSFLFEDCFPYLSLFIAIRYRNWDMHTGSIKNLAAMYRAFDRPTYQELIPRHLHDLAKLPDCILSKLREGGFAMRLSSTDWHGVALDECHEMEINKDAKLAVVRPTPDKMQFTSNYLPFRSKVIKKLEGTAISREAKAQNNTVLYCNKTLGRARDPRANGA